MKKQILIVLGLLLAQSLLAQNRFTTQIPIDSTTNTISVDVGIPVQFQLDESSEVIVLTGNELQDIASKKIILNRIVRNDTTWHNKRKKKATVEIEADMQLVKLNDCFAIDEVPVIIRYDIPKYDPKQKATFGTELLDKYGDLTVTPTEITVEEVHKKFLTCANPPAIPSMKSAPNVVQSSSTKPSFNPTALSIKTIRLVPVSAAFLNEKNILARQLAPIADKLEEETNLPVMQKAVNRLNGDITVRYFASNTQSQAKVLKADIMRLFPDKEITVEDMQPYFDYTIDDYIEIWIR